MTTTASLFYLCKFDRTCQDYAVSNYTCTHGGVGCQKWRNLTNKEIPGHSGRHNNDY